MAAKKVRSTAKAGRPDSFSDTRIIYIHGISAHPPAAVWKRFWDYALFGREMGNRTIPAYWANVLHKELAPDAWGDRSRRQARVLAKQTEPEDHEVSELAFTPANILSASGLDQTNPESLDFMSRMLNAYGIDGSQPEPEPRARTKSRRPQAKLIPLPGWLRRPLARSFMQQFFQDAAAYFLDDKKRREIQARLINQIPKKGQPIVVIAHSLGSVIAFDVLSQLKERPAVELFVTVGSPLGIREVQDEIEHHGNRLIVPNGVSAWHNFADRFDPIALDVTLQNDFTPNQGVSIHDTLIRNTERGLLNLSDAHHSGGYLSHPEVRQVVYRAIRFDANSRFLVARDVSERFETGTRQPVLIEVLEPQYPAMDESRIELVRREESQDEKLETLAGRGKQLAKRIEKIVEAENPRETEAAEITRLRKYVAARLTPDEIVALADEHVNLNIFRVWRSSPKRALINRSSSALGVDAAGPTYRALGQGITWAVLDTGCFGKHPHFYAGGTKTILKVFDCTKPGDRVIEQDVDSATDRNGHGTHVAGIIAGEYQDGAETYRGMAPQANLVIYKVLDDHGYGEDAWIIKAIDHIWRTNHNSSRLKIHGVNLSLGGGYDPTVFGCGHSPICTELRDLWRQGVLVCVAAGNEGQIEVATADGTFDLNTSLSIGDPANLEECIAVGSVHKDKPYTYGVSYFSSRGPTVDGRQKPDVVAPGEQILSCNSQANLSPAGHKNLYLAESGTSMACPHVSGLLASFLSARREFIGQPDRVKEILLANTNNLHRTPHHQGHGIPNLVKMLMGT